jgi:acyl transferase domain-containing protein/selenocysteine lyase/cysteine desulfurase
MSINDLSKRLAGLSPGKRALLALQLQSRTLLGKPSSQEPIAVLGVGCRFPGGAGSTESFWELLRKGKDAITEVPKDRWDAEAYYDPRPAIPGKTNTRWGGFLASMDLFDAAFFGISPREAMRMDPQQRLLLEVSWEALENAGQASDRLAGSTTGVFVGICTSDYATLQQKAENAESIDAYYGTGSAFSFAAGRLSYCLGLQGPSLAVDTACSSSLVAVHLACQSLRTSECSLALAGGVNLVLVPEGAIYFSQLRTMAGDGRCKAFDAAADGYVRGEGCGVVVLKRLADAIADGDPILAVICGSAVNQDGRGAGLTVPRGAAQEAVIRQALACAGLGPEQISYVETHGTGTPLGDPIEAQALGAVLRTERLREHPLAVGSVKTNIGHLEAAAGVAGLIKVILALQHATLPPHLHFRHLNPHITWSDALVVIPTVSTPWECPGGRRFAGVSSFGFSGTNAHVILSEAPPRVEATAPRAEAGAVCLLPLSARTPGALRAVAEAYRNFLQADGATRRSLRDVCYTAAVRRSHHEYRLAVEVGSREELLDRLEAFLRGEERPGLFSGHVLPSRHPRLAFVFSGAGPQREGMGRQLLEQYPVFYSALAKCEELLHRRADWSLLQEFTAEESTARRNENQVEITQVMLFALQVAVAALWRSVGIEPDAVVGHSLGEVAAAHTAGALDLEDALEVVIQRSRVLQRIAGQGAMAAVDLSEAEARRSLAGYEGRLALAAVNGPRSSVLSGDAAALAEVLDRLQHQGVFCRLLQTAGVAGHSPQIRPLQRELVKALPRLRPRPAAVPMISTITGEAVEGCRLDAVYWGRNLAEPVLYAAAANWLAGAGYDIFLEIGPHPVLGGDTIDCLGQLGREGTILASLCRGREERAVFLDSLGILYARGYPVDWGHLYPGGRFIPLPNYPWQRERYWVEVPCQRTEPLAVIEEELRGDPGVRNLLDQLLQRWGGDGAQAVNRRHLAPLVFLGSTRRCFFYFNRSGSSLLALTYVGPQEEYEGLVKELVHYAKGQALEVNVLAHEGEVSVLKGLGFSTTPCGAYQQIPDLTAFTLRGNRMRRLRAQVRHYAKQGPCTAVEYRPGSDPATDREITAVMDEWFRHKGTAAPFLNPLKQRICEGTLAPSYRLFLTRRAARIEGVILLSPARSRGGYLMDLEFHRADAPLGCLEWTVVRIIEQLRTEGCFFLSLGGTFGTQLTSHSNADTTVHEFFAALHDEKVLNGDGNFQFKRKFGPQSSLLYLCRTRGGSAGNLPDVVRMLAGSPSGEPTRSAAEVTSRGDGLGQAEAEQGAGSPTAPQACRSGATSHPLLGQRLGLAIGEVIFESRVSLISVPFLGDHRLFGITVLPGTAYLEMALAAGAGELGPGPYILRDVLIEEAMFFRNATEQTVQLILTPEGERQASFKVFSAEEDRPFRATSWRLHAAGRVHTIPPGTTPRPLMADTLEEIRSRCIEELTGGAYYRMLQERGVEYGASFQRIERLWRRDGEAVAMLRVPWSSTQEDGPYLLHPVLLDACCQLLIATLPGGGPEGESLVHVLKRVNTVSVFCPPPAQLWSHLRLRPPVGGTGREQVADLRLLDAAGQLVVELEGLSAVALPRRALLGDALGDWFYELRWLARAPRPQELSRGSVRGPLAATRCHPRRRWLILGDGQGVGRELFALLRGQGEACALALPGASHDDLGPGQFRINLALKEDVRRLLQDVRNFLGPSPWGVVHLGGLESAVVEQAPENVCAAAAQSCRLVLCLVQALAEADLADPPGVWLVTRGAQGAGRGNVGPSDVGSASLWGMGCVLAQERPEEWGGLIDLDPAATAAENAQQLCAEICQPNGETEIAFRGGQRYLRRLVRRSTLAVAGEPTQFSPDGTYLITGGLGGLGRAVGRWMVGHGARHLVLLGRNPPSAAARAEVGAWELAGAHVAVVQADVSDAQKLAEALVQISASLPPLRGVIHAAGVLSDGVLDRQPWEEFAQVLAPKVAGAWNLHRLTQASPLDFFILFSSSATILGPKGQGAHAAANAFLDALALFRCAAGLPATSINWGPWAVVGAAAERDVGRRLSQYGIGTIAPEEGLQALAQVIRCSASQVAVLPVDWRQWLRAQGGTPRPLLEQVLPVAADPESPATCSRGFSREAFLSLSAGERRKVLEAYLGQQVARVLQLPLAQVEKQQSLQRLGLDSLMAIELRTCIEADLGVKVPLATLSRQASVIELTGQLLQRLTSLLPPPNPEGVLTAPVDCAEAPRSSRPATKAYFNYGSQGPMAPPVLGAIRQAYESLKGYGPGTAEANARLEGELQQTRAAMALELGATAESIVLTENVSMGCNIVLWGLDWRPGDHLLLSDGEHPGIVGAVQELQHRFGLEVSTFPVRVPGTAEDLVGAVAERLRSRTRLVVLSHVLWNTGRILPVADIGRLCRSHSAWDYPVRVLVDAAQGVGVLPTDLAGLGVDYYAFTGHKWWCGPAGVGGLYIGPGALEDLRPTFVGWRGLVWDEVQGSIGWQLGARRFEIATAAFPLYAGLRAALTLHRQHGASMARYQQIRTLSQAFWQRLVALTGSSSRPAVTALLPSPPEAGIVSFRPADRSPEELVSFLEARGVITRRVTDPEGVRVCIHYFTSPEESERLWGGIEDFLRGTA